MRSIIITIVSMVVVVALVIYFGIGSIGSSDKNEEDWFDDSTSNAMVNASWGLEIKIDYKDGTTDIIGAIIPTFDVTFRDKKVDCFRYILSARGISNEYNEIEIDLSDFNVIATIKDEDGTLGNEIYEDYAYLKMDNKWLEVYQVQVDADDLETLESNRTYNLSFMPSGSVSYRGSSTGGWEFIPLPYYFYLHFSVNEDIPDEPDTGYDPDETGEGTEEKWIEVDISSGTYEE